MGARGDWNLPNALTVARMVAVLPLGALLWLGADPAYTFVDAFALALFALTLATDLLDGWLARRMGQVTGLGKMLDPLADKVIIAACLVFLVERRVAPAWAVAAILVREFAVTGLRSIAQGRGEVFGASQLAKAKTALQSVAILLFLAPPTLLHRFEGADVLVLGRWVLYASVLVAWVSGAQYFYGFFKAPAPSASAPATGPATR
ncbi:MAG: CDP-diacylglycerol--glycerol-3-phosphate 3-phosphatidyltransferase [Halobacteriales archaeon]|nr:CDP-diacylglycerol--glycerol-3-phosphate 3-phosphatidyltransferase [Halobacteriales archaeon]